MSPIELEAVVKNLNARVERVEQILPTLATRQDLLAARGDLLAVIETTKRDLTQAMSDIEGRLRSQMLMLHEDARSDARLLAEHLAHLTERMDRLVLLVENRRH
jgi:hypothetical protein